MSTLLKTSPVDVVQTLCGASWTAQPLQQTATVFAPTNIALCKYWGKRNIELNLPATSSVSLTLPHQGVTTTLSLHDQPDDAIYLNEQAVPLDTPFAKRLLAFLALFRGTEASWHALIPIQANLPIAAGLASSACGFAALTLALDELYAWHLPKRELSILARLGSGSAARSFWPGFVIWHAGRQTDGMDSYGEPLATIWPDLCIGLLVISTQTKPLSSRLAMQQTQLTSPFYPAWLKRARADFILLQQAIQTRDFILLGKTAESNALAMHASLLSSRPAICYYLPETLQAIQKIWALRESGLPLYFTQDAGPNLKLIFQAQDIHQIQAHFPEVIISRLF